MSMKNPFVAPDIKDLVKEQVTAERHAIYLLGSGALLVVLVVSLYYLGVALDVIPRFDVANVPAEVPEQVTDTAEPQLPTGPSVEERLAELGTDTPPTPSDQSELEARAAELEPEGSVQQSNETSAASVADRLQELQ